jgi:glycosyltransferase involved in cell wall biosynthesis
VSAFAPYKRIDLAVRACTATKRKLLVIGTGQDERRLHSLAGPTVRFLGWQPDETIREHLRRCRALLFPGEEDFGIVPVEAQACGAAVIAFGRGGATETVVPPGGKAEPTGFLFREQSVECLSESMDWFDRHAADYSPITARKQALHFNPRRFDEEIGRFVDGLGIGRVTSIRRAA